MDMIRMILIYFSAFIECFILFRIMSTVLKPKYKQVPYAVTFALFVIMCFKLSVPSLVKYQVFWSLLLLSVMFIGIYFFTENSLVEKITWFILYYFGMFVIELVMVLFISITLKQPINQLDKMNQLSVVIVCIGKLLTYLMFEAIIKRKKGKLIIGVSYFRELVIICMFNVLLLLGVVFVSYNRQDIVYRIDDVATVFLFLVFLITFYTVILIFRIEKKSNEQLETQLKIQEIELELKLNNDIAEMTDQLRKLRHDMNNHIGILKALSKTKRYEDMEEYIDQMYEDVELANDLIITGNRAVAVLLNGKKALAKQKNIEFTSMVASQDYNMLNKDICSLLANILDNAIEAAEKSKSKKFIQLMIQKTEEGDVISCENSFGIKPMIKKGRFVTNKENHQIHGIGTENIKSIVRKYNGELNFDYDDETFNIRVVIPA